MLGILFADHGAGLLTMRTILIVDDDEAMRQTLARLLCSACYLVAHAKDGSECLKSLQLNGADVVLLDLFMPNREGLETLRDLSKQFPSVPVIAMSGHRKADLMLRAAERLGAKPVLSKPFEPEELLVAIAQRLAP